MASKRAWWDVGNIFGTGDEPELKTQTIVTDPQKKALSDKLGSFYSSQIGKGASPYTGSLTTNLDPLAQTRYSEYLSKSPEELFRTSVINPTLRAFERDVLPEINESWAGYQSGSGRGYDQTTALARVSEELGTAGAKAIPSIYESQLGAGYKVAEMEALNKSAVYKEWLRTQPEYNPVLEQALKYAAGGGTETLGYWDEAMSFMDALSQVVGIGSDVANIFSQFIPGGGKKNESTPSTSTNRDVTGYNKYRNMF